jgi:hypothetical protein
VGLTELREREEKKRVEMEELGAGGQEQLLVAEEE